MMLEGLRRVGSPAGVLLTVSTGESEEGKLIEAVAAGIAHEVRNALNAMQLHVEILEQELTTLVPDRGAHVYSVLSKLANELRNLDSFVSEFLRFARPPHLNLESVSIRPLLTDL